MTDTLEAAREAVELAGKATPGPWKWWMEDASVKALYGPKGGEDFVLWTQICSACQERGDSKCTTANEQDENLIAHAGTHYGAIAAALLEAHQREEALRAEVERLKVRLSRYEGEE